MQYAILPTNDDMMHRQHKWIDRKMGKNGKWIYYYPKKPSLKAKIGKPAKEQLQETTIKAGLKVGGMSNNSREEAIAKQEERVRQQKKIDKAQQDYDNTLLGKIEARAQKGFKYLESKGIVSSKSTVTYKNGIPENKKSSFSTSHLYINGKEVKRDDKKKKR